jgi:hypothetical protein
MPKDDLISVTKIPNLCIRYLRDPKEVLRILDEASLPKSVVSRIASENEYKGQTIKYRLLSWYFNAYLETGSAEVILSLRANPYLLDSDGTSCIQKLFEDDSPPYYIILYTLRNWLDERKISSELAAQLKATPCYQIPANQDCIHEVLQDSANLNLFRRKIILPKFFYFRKLHQIFDSYAPDYYENLKTGIKNPLVKTKIKKMMDLEPPLEDYYAVKREQKGITEITQLFDAQGWEYDRRKLRQQCLKIMDYYQEIIKIWEKFFYADMSKDVDESQTKQKRRAAYTALWRIEHYCKQLIAYLCSLSWKAPLFYPFDGCYTVSDEREFKNSWERYQNHCDRIHIAIAKIHKIADMETDEFSRNLTHNAFSKLEKKLETKHQQNLIDYNAALEHLAEHRAEGSFERPRGLLSGVAGFFRGASSRPPRQQTDILLRERRSSIPDIPIIASEDRIAKGLRHRRDTDASEGSTISSLSDVSSLTPSLGSPPPK